MNQLDKTISFWQFNRHLLNALVHNWLRQASQLANTHSTRTQTQIETGTACEYIYYHEYAHICVRLWLWIRLPIAVAQQGWDSGIVGQQLLHKSIESRAAEQLECAQV